MKIKLTIAILFASLYSIAQPNTRAMFHGHNTSECTDIDALRFFDTAKIVSGANQSAVCYLVKALKDSSLWTHFQVIYPFAGGTSGSSNGVNLITPRTTAVNFNLGTTLNSGSFTNSSTGTLPSGTASTSTGYIPSSSATASSFSMSFYSRTNQAVANAYELANNNNFIIGKYTDGKAYGAVDNNTGIVSVTNTDSRGLFTISRTSTTAFSLYKNGAAIGSNNTSVADARSAYPILLWAYNNTGTALYYSSKECAFACIGDGLTSAQVATLYNIVQQYQTLLNRQV